MRTSTRSSGSASPRRSGHSRRTTPAACRSSSSPPSTTSWADASLYRSMWNSGSRPAYSPISTKLGELMVSRTPRPAPKPLAKTVLPAPSSPHRQTTSPGSATAARRAAKARVASGLVLVRCTPRSTAGAGRPSGKALEIAERDGDRRAAAEAHEGSLERDPGREPARPGEPRPGAFSTGERTRSDTNHVRRGRRQEDARVVDDEGRRV